MKPSFVGFLFLAFISGIGLGLFLGDTSSPPSGTAFSSTKSASVSLQQDSSETKSSLEFRIQELEEKLAEQQKDQDALIMNNRIALFKKYPDKIICRALDNDKNLKVTPEMMDLLELSPRQQQAIEQHFKEIQDEMQKVEAPKVVLVKQSPDSVTYEIPAYPEGKEIKAKLKSLLFADIGEDKAEVLWNKSGWTLQTQLSNFGEGKTRITITRKNGDKNISYSLDENCFSPSGSVGNGDHEEYGNTLALSPRYQRLLQNQPFP